MLKKLFTLTPLVVVSISMTACSTNKPTTKRNVITTQKTAIKKAPRNAVVKNKKFTRVVYDKRSPRKRYATKTVRRSSSNRGVNNSGASPFLNKLSDAALTRLRSRVRYDGSYVKIGYPWGDVPANTGVCTDVVIRSYRKLGIDLQKQVHQDMSAAFNNYPNLSKWNLKAPDANIDHRRVVNLRQFFARRGAALPITRNPADYKPGDLVTWMVGPGLPHIGVVVNKPTRSDPRRKMIVHNIAHGPQMEDVLFRFPMTGHYRYTPAHMGNIPRISSYASKRTPRSRGNQMSAAQLQEASRILGTTAPRRATVAKAQSKTSRSLKLAKLSAEDARILLGK